ncbi:hypothetical protein F4825DRAFT_363314 [Nemania diffusa]|nr:hypothetical protein F4825DRAFT_363314 [Nemania diffusa]
MTSPSPSPTPSPTLFTSWSQTVAGCLRTDDYWIWEYDDAKRDARTVLGGPSQTTNCFEPTWNPTITFVGSGCPPQYTSACQNTNLVVTCCPSAYAFSCQPETWTPGYNHAEWFRCVSQYASLDVVSVTRTDFTANTITVENRTRGTGLHLFALALIYTTPLSTSPPPTSSLSTSSPTSSTLSPAETPSQNSSPGLSPGAAAGVGVGAGVAIILLALLLWFPYRRKRARTAPSELETSQVPAPAPPGAPTAYTYTTNESRGLSPYSAQQLVSPPTVDSRAPSQPVDSQTLPPLKELPTGDEPLFELEGNPNGPRQVRR